MKSYGGKESSDPITNSVGKEIFDFQQPMLEKSSRPNKHQMLRDKSGHATSQVQPNLHHHTMRGRVGRVLMLHQSMFGMDIGCSYVLLRFQWMTLDAN
jgi:hypothetical protein